MRLWVLVVALVGLSATPSALADVMGAPPAAVVAYRESSGTFLAWTPAPGAAQYAVFAGPEPETLAQVGLTTSTTFEDEPRANANFYGVATINAQGRYSDLQIVGVARSECVATTTSMQVSLSIRGCLNLVP